MEIKFKMKGLTLLWVTIFGTMNQGLAENIAENPEKSLRFIQRVFADNGLINTAMKQHLRVRRQATWLRDLPLNPTPTQPNLVGNPKNEYSNFVNNLLHMVRKRKYGDPVRVNLPSLGLCNPRTCADLYKYLEEFRQSDFFLNMQTFFSLLQDKDGLDLILSVLGDPKLLQELGGPSLFSRGTNFEKKTGSSISGSRAPPKFSFSIDEQSKTVNVDQTDYSDYYDTPGEDSKTVETVEETARIPNFKIPRKDAWSSLPERPEHGAEQIDTLERTERLPLTPEVRANHGHLSKKRPKNRAERVDIFEGAVHLPFTPEIHQNLPNKPGFQGQRSTLGTTELRPGVSDVHGTHGRRSLTGRIPVLPAAVHNGPPSQQKRRITFVQTPNNGSPPGFKPIVPLEKVSENAKTSTPLFRRPRPFSPVPGQKWSENVQPIRVVTRTTTTPEYKPENDPYYEMYF